MAVTVADVEAELLTLLAPFLEKCGLDHETADGTNVALRGPIRNALLHVGGTVPGGLVVADDDLAALEGNTLERFLDVARLRAFLLCLGNWAKVDFSAGGNSQSLNQLTEALHWWIDHLEAKIATPIDPVTMAASGPAAAGLLTAGRCCTPAPACPTGSYSWPVRWGCP